MHKWDAQERIEASYKLLIADTTTRQRFDHIRTLIKGINPRIDKALEAGSHALSAYEKITTVDVIDLAATNLPEQTEEQKRRKKALLFFIQSWNQLKSEVARLKTELEHDTHTKPREQISSAARILSTAKGPFGIITLLALVIAGFMVYSTLQKPTKHIAAQQTATLPSATPSQKQSIRGIIVNGKKIPLSQLYIGHGPDCDSPHYHALNEVSATALDGTVLPDPGGCGYGRVKDVQIVNLE